MVPRIPEGLCRMSHKLEYDFSSRTEEKAKWGTGEGGSPFHVVGMRVRRETENISWSKSHLNGVLKDKVQTGREGESVCQAEKQVEERQIPVE